MFDDEQRAPSIRPVHQGHGRSFQQGEKFFVIHAVDHGGIPRRQRLDDGSHGDGFGIPKECAGGQGDDCEQPGARIQMAAALAFAAQHRDDPAACWATVFAGRRQHVIKQRAELFRIGIHGRVD